MKTKLLLPILSALAIGQTVSPLVAGESNPKPVLMVIANQDFYYQEYGDPTTAADDVIVDGRIITAENYDSASLFGRVVAAEIHNSRF